MAAPFRQIRAQYTTSTIRVYQAYSPAIAEAAVSAQRFRPPFKRERMTWIKPSFTWMMYRCGWGHKEGQERVLAIDITRAGFESALSQAAPSHFERATHGSYEAWRAALDAAPVRIQWDPERSLRLEELDWRSIQIGLSGPAVHAYVDEWTVAITDVTTMAQEIEALVRSDFAAAQQLAPREEPYPLPTAIARHIGASET